MPRFVFFKVPEEPKPMFLDFASPRSVDAFARIVRKASNVTVTEMIPSIEETWLVDADHRSYTSELRMVAVDGELWRPPRAWLESPREERPTTRVGSLDSDP
jgi:hypothetical protein